jgi:hypothetical protein
MNIMKKAVLIFLCGLLFCGYSCTVDYDETADMIYLNESNHKIRINGSQSQELLFEITLQENESKTIQAIFSPGDFMSSYVTNIVVVYDDSIVIDHGLPYQERKLNKNLFSKNSYKRTQIDEHHQRCEYTFTNEDYEEALLLMGE